MHSRRDAEGTEKNYLLNTTGSLAPFPRTIAGMRDVEECVEHCRAGKPVHQSANAIKQEIILIHR
jgi:hypothetical protein